ncbi:MAG: thiol-activated cytolysin family protein, partial [Firmicutes bacterium]|nr:thiol-activated cytolysin family protein [Bacillota bacterium]
AKWIAVEGKSENDFNSEPPVPKLTDDSPAINRYLQNLIENNIADNWSQNLQDARSISNVDSVEASKNGVSVGNTPAGYYEVFEEVKLQMSLDDLTMFGADPLIWPSNLLLLNPANYNGAFQQIVGLNRADATLSISLEGATGTGKKFTEVKSQQSAVREGISELVNNNLIQGAELPFMVATQMLEVKSEKELSLALNAKASGGFGSFSASLAASLNFKSDQKLTYAVILVRQIYYTISVDYPVNKGAAGFFEGVSYDDVASTIKPTDVPVFVSSVSFGRICAITIRSTYSFEELVAKLNVSAGGTFASGELSTEFMQNANDELMDINYFLIGGSISGNQGVFKTANQAEMMAALNSDYDPTKNIGVPISFTLAHMGNGSLAKTGTTDTYYIQNLISIPVASVMFSDSDKNNFSTLVPGGRVVLSAIRNPSTAALYPVTYSIIGATIVDSASETYTETFAGGLVSLKRERTTGRWLLEVQNNSSAMGLKFEIIASAGGVNSAPLEVQVKIPLEEQKSFITLNFNDGTSKTETLVATFGQRLPAWTKGIPTRNHYVFMGFYDVSGNTGGTQYYSAAMTSTVTWNKSENLILYARWKLEDGWAGISTAQQFDDIRKNPNGKYLLQKDLDLGIWSSPFDFTGTLAGGGYQITYLQFLSTSSTDTMGGLFKNLTNARVSDLKINVTMTRNWTANSNIFAGGLASTAENIQVSAVSVSGEIRVGGGAAHVGGLIGQFRSGTIDQSKNAAKVYGGGVTARVGGIVGNIVNQKGVCVISNSFNVGEIEACSNYIFYNKFSGGLLGFIEAGNFNVTILNCMNASVVKATGNAGNGSIFGAISGGSNRLTTINCYFDSSKCQLSVTLFGFAGCTGLTTSNMNGLQSATKYNGWSTEIWSFSNSAAPTLRWLL